MLNKRIFITAAVALAILISCTKVEDNKIRVVPKPVNVEALNSCFKLDSDVKFVPMHESLDVVANIFSTQLEPELGFKLGVGDSADGNISLNIDTTLEKEEYTLTVNRKQISIIGGSKLGVVHGIQTLRQLINKGQVQGVNIKDKPQFDYRGTMLDVGRHLFSVDDIKEFINVLSLHKINTFHWHLTEDQGWRIEISKYPELTKVGSMRSETLAGNYKTSKEYDGQPYGGFYSKEEVKEVVKYAGDLGITIIPEIEMPGHAVAALSAYPHLGCTGGPYEVRTTWGISKDVYCAGKESTFEFIQDVLTEVLELFPSEYIHIGGDECPKDMWRKCPHCQSRIKTEKLKNEYELQSYFINRIEKWLNSKGRKIIGWDEILQGKISKTAVIMAWRSDMAGREAAKDGFKVILTPKFHCYLDYSQTSDSELNNEPLTQSRFLSMRQVYRLDPYNQLRLNQRENIMGVQGNIWTEYMKTLDDVLVRALPRLAAIADIGWMSYDSHKSYDDLINRMQPMRAIYDSHSYKYSTYAFDGVE